MVLSILAWPVHDKSLSLQLHRLFLQASLPAKTAFYAVPAMQSAPAKNSVKFAFTDVMGVTVSLLSIMVMTLAGNFLLHLKVRASEKELALL